MDARGLAPDEIKQFLAMVPDELLDADEARELEKADGSNVTSYEELFKPAEGILPKKPTEEEGRKRRENIEKQREMRAIN